MSHGSAIFQVKDKCTSSVDLSKKETILKLGNTLKSKSKFTKSKIG
jgi:hypothetical protein